MAGVDILRSDKTGTPTKNQLTLSEPILLEGKDAQECILAAALASNLEDRDAIDTEVIGADGPTGAGGIRADEVHVVRPVTRRTAAAVSDRARNWVVSKGAPLAIVDLRSSR